ncbi:putative acyl-activating enzyme 19 [Andrographis paniculata]|uniref:putative acyl-activating enzyme 19 n=1 Tax=Andrographis paniculata TaxID=175694 RepID=UPI0021E82A7F|nr:putative acyl-activating enzyme 19 [Andrographis paniculata]
MAAGDVAGRKLSACCISHEFYKAASKYPDKIAVIHAAGFGGIVRDSASGDRTRDSGGIETSDAAASYSGSSVYDGDERFTFSEILCAVENLGSRLRHILDGGEDAHLLTTQPANISCEKPNNVSDYLQTSSASEQQLNKSMRNPKVVGIYMEPSVEYIVAVLSVLRCGEAFMPLDTSWPKARILSILSYSKADLVIRVDSTTDGYSFRGIDKWLTNEGYCPVLPVSIKDSIRKQPTPSRLAWPCKCERLRSFCYLIYTSGSSGKPKGVCGTEAGLLNRFLWMQEMYPPDEGDVMLFKTAISFIDHMQEYIGAMLSTCTLVIPPFKQLKDNMFNVVDFLQGYSINRLVVVPSLMRAILPSLKSPVNVAISGSLKLLVLSGEVLQIPMCKMLLKLLPNTVILNLYGSTEVTGDCTYFDCRRLSQILEKEVLSSVPIGSPLANCDVVLVGEDAPHQGEIYVSGVCVAAGYFNYPNVVAFGDGNLLQEHNTRGRVQHFFRTGDYAKRLPSGDLVFLGRKDRILKFNGHRIALEEIEGAFRDHPDVVDAAVLSRVVDGDILLLEAHVVTERAAGNELLETSLRNWLMGKLPHIMIPSCIFFTPSLPFTSSGKIDYLSLAASKIPDHQAGINIKEIPRDNLIQVIKQVVLDALMVEKVSSDDDFFVLGGNSISAAYVSFKLGIHMNLLYTHPTPRSLQMALASSSLSGGIDSYSGVNSGKLREMALSGESLISNTQSHNRRERLCVTDSDRDIRNHAKKLKTRLYRKEQNSRDNLWNPTSMHTDCSFGRCNNSRHGQECVEHLSRGAAWSNAIPMGGKGFVQELWKVDLGSCVDASPLLIFKGSDIYLFIGSHSHIFVCIDGKSGVVHWKTKLKGRVECSAAVLGDFSQVVVGCYLGNIYFLHFSDGSIISTFETNGEVKSQPVVDKRRHLVWCGSYDHNLYAIDYRSYSCIYKLKCEGSIFGSPAIDEMQGKLYVAFTSGHIVALEIKVLSFKMLWKKDMGSPIFGSLAINESDGNVICCLVDGSVVALSTCGSIVWKVKTGGPIFAGPCMSRALPSQILICSRDGCIYSFKTETGELIWKHAVGHPITSSPYVDENSQLMSNISPSPDRLICVCDSSGNVHVLRVSPNAREGAEQNKNEVVQELARFELAGDVFSSPVMIGGRIFVGCRDNNVYCVKLDVE